MGGRFSWQVMREMTSGVVCSEMTSGVVCSLVGLYGVFWITVPPCQNYGLACFGKIQLDFKMSWIICGGLMLTASIFTLLQVGKWRHLNKIYGYSPTLLKIALFSAIFAAIRHFLWVPAP